MQIPCRALTPNPPPQEDLLLQELQALTAPLALSAQSGIAVPAYAGSVALGHEKGASGARREFLN